MSDGGSRLTPLAPAQRDLFRSPAHHFVRLSFGPNMKTLDKGEWRSCFPPVAWIRLKLNVAAPSQAWTRSSACSPKQSRRRISWASRKCLCSGHGRRLLADPHTPTVPAQLSQERAEQESGIHALECRCSFPIPDIAPPRRVHLRRLTLLIQYGTAMHFEPERTIDARCRGSRSHARRPSTRHDRPTWFARARAESCEACC